MYCILHNFVHEKNGINFQNTLTVEGFQEVNPVIADRGGRIDSVMRNVYANFFS